MSKYVEKLTEEELRDYNPEQEAWDMYNYDPNLFIIPEPELDRFITPEPELDHP